MKAVVVIAAAAAALLAPEAAQACSRWNIPARWWIAQANGYRVIVDSTGQNGNRFTGKANYGPDEHFNVVNGDLEGEFTGGRVSIRIYWNSMKLGVYDGTMRDSGRMEGMGYDRDHPQAKTAWYNEPSFHCADAAPAPAPAAPAPAKPVHRLGKRPPAQAPAGGSGQAIPCMTGYVWREARPQDYVCAPPASRTRVALENARGSGRVDPHGAYGRDSCVSGYVWREAYEGDRVCVEPPARDQAREENRLAPARHVQE